MSVLRLITTIVWTCVLVSILNGVLAGQTPPNVLYLVNGFPTAHFTVGVPTRVYQFDTATAQLAMVHKVGTPTPGSSSILVDNEHRVLVIAYPQDGPTDVEILNMDSPWKVEIAHLRYDNKLGILSSNLFDVPEAGLKFSLLLSDGESEVLAGASLSTLREPHLSWKDYPYIRVAGTFGVAQPWSDALEVRIDSGGWVVPRLASPGVDHLPFRVPAGISSPTAAILFLEVNNDEVAVLSSSKDQHPAQQNDGSNIEFVLRKATKVWQPVNIPGALSRPRGIGGSWLAYVVVAPNRGLESPGRQGRSLTEVTPGYTVDELFQDNDDRYFPGILFLYNSLNGRSYRIQTGQGDSEALLVDGDRVYYRVNTSLYQATIAGDSISDTKLLIKDDSISQVHWAFIGPMAPAR